MRLVIFMPSFGDGGVERMLVNMAGGLSDRGLQVDFWVGRTAAPFLGRLPGQVRVLSPESGSGWVRALAFARYLRHERPDVVLTAKDTALRTALRVRRLAGVRCRVVARPGTTLSERLAGRGRLARWRLLAAARRGYRRADLVVANSEGVAEDVARITGIDRRQIPVVRNPVVTPDLERLAAAPVDHPWLQGGCVPVLLGAGGLRRQKDFATLVRAFAEVRAVRPSRLVILGRGRLAESLRALARTLGVEQDLALPGFVENPYPWLRRASVFVLSSRWEGSPNVLTEALALGTPVVATDCPSGPREVLQGGRVGALVPVADPPAMARAILQTLDAPPPRERLRAAVAEYTVEENARRYEALLRTLTGRPDPAP